MLEMSISNVEICAGFNLLLWKMIHNNDDHESRRTFYMQGVPGLSSFVLYEFFNQF